MSDFCLTQRKSRKKVSKKLLYHTTEDISKYFKKRNIANWLILNFFAEVYVFSNVSNTFQNPEIFCFF